MKPIVKITQEMRDVAYKFAYDIEMKHDQYPRLGQNENELVETTYVGKLGELAFLSYLNSNDIFPDTKDLLEIFPGQNNVDSFDFPLRKGHTVDVKTGYLRNHKRLMVNEEQLSQKKKDVYVGVKLLCDGGNPEVAGDIPVNIWTRAEIEGWATYEEIMSMELWDFGKATARAKKYDDLRPIETLLKFFHF